MAKGINQLQAEILAYLNTIKANKDKYDEVTKLPAVEQLLILSAANFILKVQDNLKTAKKIDTGGLEDGITAGELIKTSTGYEMSLGYKAGTRAAKYFDFVNKGVKGFIDESKAPNSPYKYKSEYPKWGGELHKAILGWYRRNSFAARSEDQRKGLSGLQKKRKKLLKMVDKSNSSKSLAYATAINIKRKGLKTTGFFDKAIEQSYGQKFVDTLGVILGEDLKILISYGNNS